MKQILVLGAGMVGSAMAIDMAKKHQVTLADINRVAKRLVRIAFDAGVEIPPRRARRSRPRPVTPAWSPAPRIRRAPGAWWR